MANSCNRLIVEIGLFKSDLSEKKLKVQNAPTLFRYKHSINSDHSVSIPALIEPYKGAI